MFEVQEKTCAKCLIIKPLSEFSIKRANGTRHARCNECRKEEYEKRKEIVKARSKAWNDAHKEDAKKKYRENRAWYLANARKDRDKHWNNWLKRTYGIDADIYFKILRKQGGGCAICGDEESRGVSKKLVVDHCHETGMVRGILCHHCNVAIGSLKHSTRLLETAKEYLEKGAVSSFAVGSAGNNNKTACSGGMNMALRGKPPETISKRLKCMMFGPPGVGKTTAAIQFPKPYLIDTERGAENDQYVRKLNAVGGAYFFTTDPDDLISEVKALLGEKHDYQTVIIDPLTIIYNDLLDHAAAEVGTDFGKHKGPADRKIKHLLALLLRLDMNVIITSHAKAKWTRSKDARGKDTVIEDGVTYDCYGKLDYLFDLVFEVEKRGLDRVGKVRKTRVDGFPEGDIFPFCYEEIAQRYGKDILERSATPVKLANAALVARLQGLLDERKDGEQLKEKWLGKANAETLDEMPEEAAFKCVQFLTSGKAVASAV